MSAHDLRWGQKTRDREENVWGKTSTILVFQSSMALSCCHSDKVVLPVLAVTDMSGQVTAEKRPDRIIDETGLIPSCLTQTNDSWLTSSDLEPKVISDTNKRSIYILMNVHIFKSSFKGSINMWPDAVLTFNRPLSIQIVCLCYLWIILNVVKNAFNIDNILRKKNRDLQDTLLRYKFSNPNWFHTMESLL